MGAKDSTYTGWQQWASSVSAWSYSLSASFGRRTRSLTQSRTLCSAIIRMYRRGLMDLLERWAFRLVLVMVSLNIVNQVNIYLTK